MTMLTDLDRLAALAEAARYGVITTSDDSRDDSRESTDMADSSISTGYRAFHAARAHRGAVLARMITAAIESVGRIARRVRERYLQRRHAKLTYDALRQLDDRTLHDLGFDRSEMTSVAAEVAAEAEYSRVRALLSSRIYSA